MLRVGLPLGLRHGVPGPTRPHKVTVPDSQGAGQMYSIGAPKGMDAREVPGLAFNRSCQLDRPYSAPVLLPRILGGGQVPIIEIMIATSSPKCRSYLWIHAKRLERVASQPSHRSATRSLPASSTTSFINALESK